MRGGIIDKVSYMTVWSIYPTYLYSVGFGRLVIAAGKMDLKLKLYFISLIYNLFDVCNISEQPK